MATIAHGLFCFEVLSASLEKRDHLSLCRVEDLWVRFQLREHDTLEGASHNDTRGLNDDPELQHGDEIMSELDDDHEELSSDDEEPESAEPAAKPSALQLPSISRLQAPSPSSASASSTPSSASASSSRLRLDDSSSRTSSSTSFFSFGRRSQQPSPVVRDDQYPLFVTWNTISGRGHKTLRGCIGTFEPQELSSGLKNYALTAAFDDTRFAPIHASELSSLATHITLLHTFTPCAHPLDWSLGKHGLRISFTHHGRRLGATYLPDVAVEQGWTKEETVISLMRKAGWTGRTREWRTVGNLRAVRYEGKGADCRWNSWREWRDWVDRIGEGRRTGK
ncbi:MAG: hypothetical protein Q9218_006541 [Villophora microphyllina]